MYQIIITPEAIKLMGLSGISKIVLKQIRSIVPTYPNFLKIQMILQSVVLTWNTCKIKGGCR